MKTAEEWLYSEQWHKTHDAAIIDNIKQIQLDAWKQGMSDAANTAHAVFMGYEHQDPKPAILQHRDNKLSIDTI